MPSAAPGATLLCACSCASQIYQGREVLVRPAIAHARALLSGAAGKFGRPSKLVLMRGLGPGRVLDDGTYVTPPRGWGGISSVCRAKGALESAFSADVKSGKKGGWDRRTCMRNPALGRFFTANSALDFCTENATLACARAVRAGGMRTCSVSDDAP